MENYKQKYKHALNLAKQVYDSTISEQQKENISIIFPELKESEDERISKAIIAWLKSTQYVPDNQVETLNSWIAWLEKQGHDGKKWIYEDEYIKEKERTFQDGIDEVLENPQKYGLEKQEEKSSWSEEEEKLTEFEKELEMMIVSFSNGNLGSDVIKEMPKQKLYNYAQKLLDLARKELLKDLPKWKKATEDKKFDKHVCVMDYYIFPFLDTEVNEGDYYIKLEDLKTLPKEE